MDPMDLTQLASYAAMWHYMYVNKDIQDTVYIRARCVALDCRPRWEPWNNH
ncbi:hypothetical protein VP01_2631g6 [Puccinia sorghi]|uniref:Uncharacterized protein n=1 Tax=Puccinia sorghi TaxID=27349 RepID=A0A0L6V4A9_9BASI|nr:hypothetical protein VP01_2631g6 [Puccinia sorghi]